MPARTPSERSLIARIASDDSWSRTADRAARTAPGRQAFLDRFEKQVDPDGVLDPADRAVRADHARRAYFSRLALKSAQSRRRAAELVAEAEVAEVELSELDGAA
jgi:hypothetical protein